MRSLTEGSRKKQSCNEGLTHLHSQNNVTSVVPLLEKYPRNASDDIYQRIENGEACLKIT